MNIPTKNAGGAGDPVRERRSGPQSLGSRAKALWLALCNYRVPHLISIEPAVACLRFGFRLYFSNSQKEAARLSSASNRARIFRLQAGGHCTSSSELDQIDQYQSVVRTFFGDSRQVDRADRRPTVRKLGKPFLRLALKRLGPKPPGHTPLGLKEARFKSAIGTKSSKCA